MADTSETLDSLRREIDAIDDAMHDLIMRRAGVVERVRQAKGAAPAFRPAREAILLRRLARRHAGAPDVGVVVRMWREMITGLLAVQEPFSVAVTAPADQPGLWDVARDHFGSRTPMHAYAQARDVMRALADKTAAVGVLPWPTTEDANPWWQALDSTALGALRVVALLPFAGPGNARGAPRALAVCGIEPEPTGEDRTMIVVETVQEVSRTLLVEGLGRTGERLRQVASCPAPPGGKGQLVLVELDGFVPPGDPRLGVFRKALGDAVRRVQPVGAYAVPLVQGNGA